MCAIFLHSRHLFQCILWDGRFIFWRLLLYVEPCRHLLCPLVDRPLHLLTRLKTFSTHVFLQVSEQMVIWRRQVGGIRRVVQNVPSKIVQQLLRDIGRVRSSVVVQQEDSASDPPPTFILNSSSQFSRVSQYLAALTVSPRGKYPINMMRLWSQSTDATICWMKWWFWTFWLRVNWCHATVRTVTWFQAYSVQPKFQVLVTIKLRKLPPTSSKNSQEVCTRFSKLFFSCVQFMKSKCFCDFFVQHRPWELRENCRKFIKSQSAIITDIFHNVVSQNQQSPTPQIVLPSSSSLVLNVLSLRFWPRTNPI